MEKRMQDILPIMGVEHDVILSRQGDMTVVFQAELPEIFTLSDQEYEALHQAWIRAVKVLPAHAVMHKQDWFTRDSYKPDFESLSRRDGGEPAFLRRSSERYFNERPFLRHSCYILLTKKPAGRKDATSLLSGLLRGKIVPEETLHPRLLHEFLDYAGQFRRILEDTGFVKLTRLGSPDLLSGIRRCGLIERYCYLCGEKDVMPCRDIEFRDGVRVGDLHCRLFTLANAEDMPGLCGSRIDYDRYSSDSSKFSVGFASSLGQLLNCNHIYNQYIFTGDPRERIKKLESRRLRLQSLSAYSRKNLIARDATNDFLNEAIAGHRLPVKAHFNILAWTDDPKELKELKNRVSAALVQTDARAKEETVGAPQIFWAGIPGNAADFPMNDTFDTFAAQACCFLNLETAYRSSSSPIGIRLGDRQTGRPLHVDISDEPIRKGICTNRNKFILGPTGSGKSFFTNHMLRSYYEQGAHIVLVDVGHSYKGLCQLVHGYYFTYEENNPIRFNPFHISSGDRLDTERKESLKSLLMSLWKKEDEHLNRAEYVALSGALTGYYQYLSKHKRFFACFDTFYEYVRDEYAKVLASDKVKEKDFDLDNFLYVLRPYYKGGEFDYLLNARENLDLLKERFIVFELDSIKDHPILFPIVTLVIMDVFISKMRKLKGVRKMILIEEAWKAIAREGMAEYIKYLFKTVRKFFGEAIVVTQDIEDIISSPVVRHTIINNSDCKILLDMNKYQHKFDEVQRLLSLTEKEKALVLSVNRANDASRKYKEVFISLGGVCSKVYRVEVSPEEYLTYTTEETEKMKVTEYAGKWGSMQKGIEMLVRETNGGSADKSNPQK
jgi:conjugation system TraG family ATPase